MKNQKGITMISLVITIIVLLILAAISVAMLTGNNGMIVESNKAREEHSVGEEKEIIKSSYSAIKIELLKKADGKREHPVPATDLQKQILDDMGISSGVSVAGSGDGSDEFPYTVTMPSGRKYKVNAGESAETNENLEITEIE